MATPLRGTARRSTETWRPQAPCDVFLEWSLCSLRVVGRCSSAPVTWKRLSHNVPLVFAPLHRVCALRCSKTDDSTTWKYTAVLPIDWCLHHFEVHAVLLLHSCLHLVEVQCCTSARLVPPPLGDEMPYLSCTGASNTLKYSHVHQLDVSFHCFEVQCCPSATHVRPSL